jgi:hypothetical protein
MIKHGSFLRSADTSINYDGLKQLSRVYNAQKSVPTPRKHTASLLKDHRFMLFRETITVYSENRIKAINTVW